ncbi:hypothetical protein KIN20_026743 [Parelaphostrongylus tenuis]|uniref:Uncharacterized protein n=1 Tax=Parelaphostrongylus tenuis TaxID=148309 RepID=A0AAD5WDC0_PARTN|nr:hypothetical protein KIN20_026743 [Parelaphostrongylus tenuis]
METTNPKDDPEEQSWDEFCTFESIGIHEFTGPTAKEHELQNMAIWQQSEETREKRDDGYYVRLPWKDDAQTLPETRNGHKKTTRYTQRLEQQAYYFAKIP